ncbi:kinase-like protein [Schizopora paradoxa]|uniref:Kinase-like protein n=1 Tax=Schizopora paradoxa TaxID=27342 RepID=A0A0H2SAI9_9AGAM|nr:kinase-like protein [Schizopora paradoxa]
MDPLEKILSGLSNLNLDGKIVRKQPHASGLGGSCDVYSAWSKKHHKKVAVKQIRAYLRKDRNLAKKLAAEIRIWARLDHEFVLPLLGFFVEGENMMPALISEWMERGTLHDIMRTFPRGGINTLIMLRDIASGLSYLHSNHVIHADLKSQNILISASGSPLIADFGLSLAISQSQSTMGTTSTSTKGTVRWMAIELLPSASVDGAVPVKPNKKTDIWSFGMVIYELLSWQVPYREKSNDVQVLMAIVNGELPKKPDPDKDGDRITFDTLWDVARSCWDRCASRPTAHKLWGSLSLNAFARKIGFCDEDASNRALKGIRQESQTSSFKFEPERYHNVRHLDSFGCGPREGHDCQIQVIDDIVTFSCHPANLIGPISKVELGYIANPTM